MFHMTGTDHLPEVHLWSIRVIDARLAPDYCWSMREWSAPSLPPSWTRSGQSPFVARNDEVAELEAAWADAVGGAGRAVFIAGDPGVGKSRLVSVVCTALHGSGATVLVGACVPEYGAPFEPFDQLIRDLLPAFADGGDKAELRASIGLLERTFSRPADSSWTPGAEVGQGRLYEAVIDVLRAAARIRPLVLVVEDLHWADVTAVRLLSRIAAAAADSRLLLIGTFRATSPDRSETLADALAELCRLDGVRRIQLEPLTIDDIATYVSLRAGTSLAAARHPAAVLRELTGGNPFLLRETWRQVVDSDGQTERERGTRIFEFPDTVRDVMHSRIRSLDPPTLHVLELAALLGNEVDLRELLAISDAPAATTLRAVDVAVSTRLLDPPRPGEEGYRFPHAIARQSVIDNLSGTDAMRLHAAIAQTLESRFPAAPRLVQRLAHHYTAARVLGFDDRAVTYLTGAAELADARLAHEDAGRLFERAADIALDSSVRDNLRLRAAASWTLAADFARARALTENVIEHGDARSRLEAAVAFEEASWRPGLPGQRAVELLTPALAGFQAGGDDPLFVEGLSALSRATAFTGAVGAAESLETQAIALARRIGDERVLASALRRTVGQTFRPHALQAGLARSAELTALASRAGMRKESFGVGPYFRSAACYILGDRRCLDESERDLAEAAGRWGSYWHYWVECLRFGRLFSEGRLAEAAEANNRVRHAERTFKSDATLGANALQSYMVRRESGALDSVRSYVTGEESPTSRWAPGLLALYTEFEMVEPARRLLRWLLDHDEPASHEAGDWPARLVFLTEAAVWLADSGAARRLQPWVTEYSGLNLMSGYFVAVFGSADRYLGQLEFLCATGSPIERFEAALELDERSDASLHVAETLAVTARHLHREEPGSQRAAEAIERARAIAEPAQLNRVLRLLKFDQARPGVSFPDGLTAREIEVIRLVAEGLSNREIAHRLVLSEHTAANHVRSILAKTRSENRTQAARYARERGLLQTDRNAEGL